MITVAFITLIVLALAFVFATIWGRQSREEEKDKIVWEKPLPDETENFYHE